MTKIDKLKKKIKALEEKNKKLKENKFNDHVEIKKLDLELMQKRNLLEFYSSDDFMKIQLKEFHKQCMMKGLFSFPLDQKFYDHDYKNNKVFYMIENIPIDADRYSTVSLKVFIELENPEPCGAAKRLGIEEIIMKHHQQGISIGFEEAMARCFLDRDKNQAAQTGLQKHKLIDIINEVFVRWNHTWLKSGDNHEN